MPSPSATDMALLAKQKFAEKHICLPDHFERFFPRSKPGQRQLIDAIPRKDRNVPPSVSGPDLLFDRHLPIAIFARRQESLCKSYAHFIDQICTAICTTWAQWQQAVKLTAVTYTAGMAMGGQAIAAPWAPSIIGTGPKVPWTPIIANAITTAWTQLELSLKFAGTPLFMSNLPIPVPPGGDAVPGIPLPSGPLPFKAAFPAHAPILKDLLVGLMTAATPPPAPEPGKGPPSLGPHSDAVYDAIAHAFCTCFDLWTQSTLVINSVFLITCVNPAPAPIPRMAGICPVTTGPFLLTPMMPPAVYVPQPWQVGPAQVFGAEAA